MEIGVLFWRHQFTKALRCGDIAKGRLILDSVQTETSDDYQVEIKAHNEPLGHWYIPRERKTEATILYFHGGGYSFYGAMSHRFGAMLAHRIGARVFAPDYRMTPEHSHPIQSEDALVAWKFMTEIAPHKDIVVIGDSAGAHMMLMMLQNLKQSKLPQPAGAIALSPWTDIGDSGPQLHANDEFDLVQGWMAVQFGEWLDPSGNHRAALSPDVHDFTNCSPIYLQAGGREIFEQTSITFAETQKDNGAQVMLDIWPDMPHDFQLYDSTQTESTEALVRISDAVRYFVSEKTQFSACTNTRVTNQFKS